jgi:hypothetical protein
MIRAVGLSDDGYGRRDHVSHFLVSLEEAVGRGRASAPTAGLTWDGGLRILSARPRSA